MEAGGADATIVGQGQQDSTSVTYTCGGCGAKNWVKPQDQIRCRACGYRILYKMRTKRMVQHECR